MLMSEMTRDECRDLVTRLGFGRLACAHQNQPYIVPIYFAYEPDHLYGFTTLGRKVEWMRSNPLVCVEVDEVLSHFRWSSVVVLGRYENFQTRPNTPACDSKLRSGSKEGPYGGKQRMRQVRSAVNPTRPRQSSIASTSRR